MTAPPPVRAVLLDVDDTLVDTRAAMRAAGAACARAAWPDTADDASTAFGVHYHADPGGFFRRYTCGELTFDEMRLARLRHSAAAHGLAWGDSSSDVFEDAWPDAFRSAVALFDDVVPFLARCRAAGVVVGVLTNSSERFTQVKLEAVGLADAFRAIATTDTLGYGKPDPRAFTHACSLLGVPPDATCYVGDDLDVDARAARAAGLVSIWLDRRGGDDPGDVQRVGTLADIPL